MTILVTGATGNIGRRVVDHLIDLGANDIRALTKNPAKATCPTASHPSSATSAIRIRFEACSRAETEQALRPAMGDDVGWYLDLLAEGVESPQYANSLVAELTGTPAQTVAQWAARNAELFV
jgi:nucleoside-diphosphate-sugar epimerase